MGEKGLATLQKILYGEHDRVNKLSEDAKRAVEFGSRIVKLTTSSDEAGHSAWQALDARVSSLVNAELCDTPPLHSNLDFQAVIDGLGCASQMACLKGW